MKGIDMIKNLVRRTRIFPYALILYRKLKIRYNKIKGIPRHPIQDSKTVSGYNITYLGSHYGGWNFVDEDTLKGSTIISAGLGEDASFDIEFASKYNAKVIIIDPTPRAITHFNAITNSLGKQSTCNYSFDGCQPIESYDLSNVNQNNFSIITKALWNENTKLKFFEPNDPSYVSHSIINYQNKYSKNTKSIEVEAVTLASLLKDLNLKVSEISIMKLDIEGAEIEVLKSCVEEGILPRQILVEYDELSIPSEKAYNRVTEVDNLLKVNGYKLIKTDGQEDFLYYR